ncbi:gamma-glutamyltransferase [Leuconostoc mesenteroides subsp. dextranicum]|uniref:gamma-glutamyltransferase n=1 Tax=Leuconostoc mesenteroides TaxID=1245 RepID=UPI003CB40DA3
MKYLKKIGSLLLIVLGIVFLIVTLGSSKNNSINLRNLSEKISWQKNKTQTTNKQISVSTSNPYATKVGVDILRNGGNADAAVGVSYALAVTEPYASGLGGGGGMIIYDPQTRQYHGVDYRDSAPISHKEISSEIGVPTFVKGMDYISRQYGAHSMSKNMQASVDLAQDGFKVSPFFAKYINVYRYFLKRNSDYLNHSGNLLKKGETMHPEKLAQTLTKIQEKGIAAYYSGSIANLIMAKSDLTQSDLNSARVEITKPVVTKIGNDQYATLAPPFSGTTLLQMLKIANKVSMADPMKDPDSYLKQYSAIRQLTYHDRLEHLGDPTHYQIDYQKMVSSDYINKLMNDYGKPLSLNGQESDSQNTTHFSIIDKNGMAVSSTNTLGSFYGSQVEAGGFYLNAANRLFASDSKNINSYEPGKKPRNFTAPTIIKTGDNKTIALGTPGGNMIPEFLFQIIYDHQINGTGYQKSINKTRLYMPNQNQFVLETSTNRPNYLALEKINHTSYTKKETSEFFGSVQIAYRDDKTGQTHTYGDNRRDENLNER